MTCFFYLLTGLYCPGCGGTRGMHALLQGHVLLSIHENPMSLFLVLTGCLFLTEQILQKTGHEKKILPKSRLFWYSVLLVWLVWAVLRNFLPVLQPVT